jgi:hypothetical protein
VVSAAKFVHRIAPVTLSGRNHQQLRTSPGHDQRGTLPHLEQFKRERFPTVRRNALEERLTVMDRERSVVDGDRGHPSCRKRATRHQRTVATTGHFARRKLHLHLHTEATGPTRKDQPTTVCNCRVAQREVSPLHFERRAR